MADAGRGFVRRCDSNFTGRRQAARRPESLQHDYKSETKRFEERKAAALAQRYFIASQTHAELAVGKLARIWSAQGIAWRNDSKCIVEPTAL